jgi:hypothetical protein
VQVRLKQNIILDSKFYERGSVIDDELLPDHLKENASVITRDLEDRSKAMLLKEMHYSTCYRDHEGFNVSQPKMLGIGELIASEEIPEGWRENEDFKFGWTPEERRAIQQRAGEEYVSQFQPKSEEPYENIGYHSARNRRG